MVPIGNVLSSIFYDAQRLGPSTYEEAARPADETFVVREAVDLDQPYISDRRLQQAESTYCCAQSRPEHSTIAQAFEIVATWFTSSVGFRGRMGGRSTRLTWRKDINF